MVGLGNVDNTSDLDNPISNLTQTALHGKQGTLTSVTDLSSRTVATTGSITGNQGSFAYTASTGALKPGTISQTGCYLGCDSNNQAGLELVCATNGSSFIDFANPGSDFKGRFSFLTGTFNHFEWYIVSVGVR
ncbi:MAG: hypothetical protein ACKPKO_48450, partial [Candidatus Fonsibacter sp.]